MSVRINYVGWLLLLVVGSRLLGMWLLPLADTSEPRYAEIARVMAQSGDWITPWFEPGLPFWGKPPLAFWSEALAFRLFGVSDFAVRLPSWLATLATLWLVFRLARGWYGTPVAMRTVLIHSSLALVYVASGAVLTDPFLVLGTTWVMTALALARQESHWYWRYGLFLGLALGLLAKGPLVLVLVGLSLLLWWLLHADARAGLRALPWWRGVLLMLVLTLPWYLAAEAKTPGFLHYFLVGEHFLRFVDAGWAGDLYGSAHQRMRGTIWLYWLLATFPWGLVALWLLLRRAQATGWWRGLANLRQDGRLVFLLGWSLATPVFFTAAGNILWTYLLPALPAFSVLLARALERSEQASAAESVSPRHWPAALVPVGVLLFGLAIVWQPQWLKTEKKLVEFVQQEPAATLLYVDSRPFSARYYSRGQAGLISMPELVTRLSTPSGQQPLYLAVPLHRTDDVRTILLQVQNDVRPVFESQGYQLFEVAGKRILTQVPPPASTISSCQPSCSHARLTM